MASAKTVKTFAWAVAISLLIAVGMLSWMFYVGSEFQKNLDCVVDQIDEMEKNGDDGYKTLMADNGVKDITNMIRDHGHLLLVFTLVPGIAIIVWLSLVVGCACRTEDGRGYCWAKCFIFLSQAFLYLGIAFYLAIAAMTHLLESGSVADKRKDFEETCDTVVKEAKDKLMEAEQSGYGDHETAVQIRGQVQRAEETCFCVDNMVGKLTDFFVPAVINVVVFVFLTILVKVMCCKMGCICSNAGKKKPEKGVEFTNVAGQESKTAAAVP